MANVTITGLPPVASLDLTAVFPIVQGNVTQKTTLAAIQGVVTSNVANLSVGNLTVGNITATGLTSLGTTAIGVLSVGDLTANTFVANSISGNIANTTGGYGDPNVNTLLGNLTVDIIPSSNNVLNLGSPSLQFKDIYLSNSTLYFDSVPLTIAGANTLQVAGENVVTTSNGNSVTQGNVVVSGDLVAGNVIGNVAVSNVVGLGNIATLNLNGNGSTYLNGNGVWAAVAVGSNYGDSNVEALLSGGTVTTDIVTTANVSGDTGLFNEVNINNNSTNVILFSDSNRNVSSTTFSYDVNTDDIVGSGNISTTGNVVAGFLKGNVALATGLGNIVSVNKNGNSSTVLAGDGTWIVPAAGYGNANVSTYLASGNANTNITTTANVSGAYILGNISAATGLGNIKTVNLNGNGSTYLNGNGVWAAVATNNYGNSNVADYLPVNPSNVAGDYFSATGNVSVGYVGTPFQIDSVVSSTPTNVTLEGPSIIPFPVSDGQTIVISGATLTEAGINGTWTVSNVSSPNFDIDCTDNTAANTLTGVSGTVIAGGFISGTGNVTADSILAQGFYGFNGSTAVGNMVVIPGIKGAPNKLLIATAEGAVDGSNGIDMLIRAGNSNESGGTAALGGTIGIQSGLGTANGLVTINTAGGRVILGNPSEDVEVESHLSCFRGADVGGTLTAYVMSDTRIEPRVQSITSGATVTIDGDSVDQYNITDLAVTVTFDAPSGVPTDGQKLTIRILDNGTSQTLNWDPIFFDMTGTLPSATVAGKLLYVGVIWNADSSQWDVVSVVQQTV